MIDSVFMGFLYIAAWLTFFIVVISILGFAYIGYKVCRCLRKRRIEY